MSRGRSRVDALERQLKRYNPKIHIQCQSLERRRCTVQMEVGEHGGVTNLSRNLLISELEEWVDGYTKCKEARDMPYDPRRIGV